MRPSPAVGALEGLRAGGAKGHAGDGEAAVDGHLLRQTLGALFVRAALRPGVARLYAGQNKGIVTKLSVFSYLHFINDLQNK